MAFATKHEEADTQYRHQSSSTDAADHSRQSEKVDSTWNAQNKHHITMMS